MLELILGLCLVLLALLGAPLFVVLGGAGLVFFMASGTPLSEISGEHYKLADNAHLITIPLFTFAGFLMAESQAAARLVRVSRAFFGWMPGGLAIVVIVSCAFFTTFTGASGVTIIALGGLLFPMLVSENYPEEFGLGLITASGSIGLLFPPSLPIILYGIVAVADIDKLFVAGVLPGMLMLSLLGVYAVYIGVTRKTNRTPFDAKEAFGSAWEAKWELFVPGVVLAGIYGGFVTVAEASALAALYVLVVEVFITKDIRLFPAKEGDDDPRPDLSYVIREAMVMVGAIMLILGVALGLTNYLVQEEVPMKILAVMEQYIESKYTFLILLNVFLLIVGCLMDIFSAIIVVVPLITPIALSYGVDPTHLGVIFLANVEIGYITPPVGLNLFIASLAFNKPVVQLYRMAIPFLLILLVALMVITFVPELSLWLVDALGVGG